MIDMDAIRAAKAAQHPERIAVDGSIQKSKEAAEFRNKLIDWHQRGKPQDELAGLKAIEKDLRKRKLF